MFRWNFLGEKFLGENFSFGGGGVTTGAVVIYYFYYLLFTIYYLLSKSSPVMERLVFCMEVLLLFSSAQGACQCEGTKW